MTMSLLESKKRIDISDMQLPWRPIFAILEKELFPKQRKTGLTYFHLAQLTRHHEADAHSVLSNVSSTLLYLTEYSQRFFPPHEIPAMLQTFLPRLSASLNSILATQAFCVHFLPVSHPQYYLPAVFKLWEAFNSGIWDEQWLDFMERLTTKHLDPRVSHPAIVEELRVLAREAGETVVEGTRVEDLLEGDEGDAEMSGDEDAEWKGIRKDVGIYTDAQWAFIMTKCLRTMGESLPTLFFFWFSFLIFHIGITRRRPRRRRHERRRRWRRRERLRDLGRERDRRRSHDEKARRQARVLRGSDRLLEDRQ